jgi:hypothetical protein
MSTENVFGGNITAQDIDCDNITVVATIDVDSLQVATSIVTPQITAFNSTGTGVAGQAFLAGATNGTAGGATGGVGGAATFRSGTGGGGTTTGGAGGTVAITAGAGGNGVTTGGVGGNLNLTAGAAGTGGNVNGGSVVLTPGTGTGTGAPGQVVVTGLQTKSASAAAITSARVLSVQDAGGIFTVTQPSVYTITLPSPATVGAGLRFTFMLLTNGANTVSVILPAGINFKGTIVNDVTSVIPATGVSMNFIGGTAAIGDSIEVFSIDAANYGVRAVTSAVGGITVT